MFHYDTLTEAQCLQFTRFASFLQEENRVHNLTRIVETPQIYLRHFADALEALPWLDEVMNRSARRPRLIDVGSGAGLPGLAIAIARPEWQVLSLDATGKKIAFQQRLIRALGLKNASALQGRAEELAHRAEFRERFDAATARAVGHLQLLCELCAGFLKVGGRMVTVKGSVIDPEIDQARPTLGRLFLVLKSIRPYSLRELAAKTDLSLGEEDAHYRLLVLDKTAKLPPCYPRTFGAMKKALQVPSRPSPGDSTNPIGSAIRS